MFYKLKKEIKQAKDELQAWQDKNEKLQKEILDKDKQM